MEKDINGKGKKHISQAMVFIFCSSGYSRSNNVDFVNAVAALAFGYIYDRRGVGALILSTILSAPFALFIFAFDSIGMVLWGVVLWGIGMGAQESILKAVVTTMVPKNSRATGYGIFECSFGIFWFLGIWLLGVLYDFNITAMIVVSVAAQLLAIPMYYLSARERG